VHEDSIHATARAETNDILAHIAEDNSPAAVSIGAAIKTAIAQLASFPRMGTETDEADVYVKIARPYHYLIFYSVADSTVLIHNVRHPARQRPSRERS
jgi:plasmid stabilization system protein ParE